MGVRRAWCRRMNAQLPIVPTRFRLGHRLWRVKVRKGLRHDDGTVCDGVCDFNGATIWLDRALFMGGNSDRLQQVWEHELLHALLDAHGVTDHDEKLIDGMATLRCQFEHSKRGELKARGL